MVEPCGQSLRNHYVIHEPQLHRLFSLQSGTWPARGEHRHLPWPQWWNHPLHRVAGSMSVALDVPLFVYFVALRRNDFRRQRQIACREDHSVESRSEEHTSELQSRLHLVCRLLLEKKKNKRLVLSS